MKVSVFLYSNKTDELNKFLSKFYNSQFDLKKSLKWQKEYDNPIEISDIIGVYTDNIDNFKITMWISLDKNIYINITENNSNRIIKYLYERFPY